MFDLFVQYCQSPEQDDIELRFLLGVVATASALECGGGVSKSRAIEKLKARRDKT